MSGSIPAIRIGDLSPYSSKPSHISPDAAVTFGKHGITTSCRCYPAMKVCVGIPRNEAIMFHTVIFI
jgi:hypothetical protein